MRIDPLRAPARLAAALLALGLGACNFGRNVSDDCWIDRGEHAAAQSFRTGLRARNLPLDDPAWELAEARIAKSRAVLRACEDGAAGLGRPDVESLSHGAGHAPEAAGGHGA